MVIKGKLIQHENIKDKLIEQTYDGASVMSDHLNGVQAQVENLVDNPTGWDDETLDKVSGLHGYLTRFLFCFLVLIFQKIFEQSSILYSILQGKDTDFQYDFQ